MVIDPSPRLPKGKGAPFSLGALDAHMRFAFMQDTHPRPFPKGRENPTRKVRIVFPNVQVSHKSFERRNLPSLWEGPGMGQTPQQKGAPFAPPIILESCHPTILFQHDVPHRHQLPTRIIHTHVVHTRGTPGVDVNFHLLTIDRA